MSLHLDEADLLDYFAGQAIAGLLARGDTFQGHGHGASDAYDIAAAMLTERRRLREQEIVIGPDHRELDEKEVATEDDEWTTPGRGRWERTMMSAGKTVAQIRAEEGEHRVYRRRKDLEAPREDEGELPIGCEPFYGPGEGYRYLGKKAVIRSGDQWRHCIAGAAWTNATNSIGFTVEEYSESEMVVAPIIYRRRI